VVLGDYDALFCVQGSHKNCLHIYRTNVDPSVVGQTDNANLE